MRISILTGLFLLQALASYGQQYMWSADSISREDPNFEMDRYHDVLRYHDPLMYLAYPYVKPLTERKVALADGEGKNGYWAEGQFAYRFVVYKGKYFSYPLLQRMRLTFDVGVQLRLTNDNSSPLLPSNNKFGAGLDILLSSPDKLRAESATLVWLTAQLHHYSNGQADSFFRDGRNNYRGGDFSTNYARGQLHIASNPARQSIFSGYAGYQREVDFGKPLERSAQLKQYYGFDRILFGLQWMQKPMLSSVNFRNRGTGEDERITLQRRRQFGIRTELEYITGDLSLYPGDNKYRIGWHTYLTYMPSVANEVGVLLHTYVGRDYLNIRFDDPVFIAEAGLYVKFASR